MLEVTRKPVQAAHAPTPSRCEEWPAQRWGPRCSHTPAQGTGQRKRSRGASLSLLGKLPRLPLSALGMGLHLPFLEGHSRTPRHLPATRARAARSAPQWTRAASRPWPPGFRRACSSPPRLPGKRGLWRPPEPVWAGPPEARLQPRPRPPHLESGSERRGGAAGWPGARAALWSRQTRARRGGGSRGRGRGSGERPQRGRNRSRERRGGGAGMERASPGCARPRHHDSVEAWLDDHWDFTFSYFVRKATR